MATEADIVADYFIAEDKTLVFTVYQADGTTRQNLTGFTGLSWMLKQYFTDLDSDALIEKTLGNGLAITDAANGICEVTLSAADILQVIGDSVYHHELKRTDAPKTVLSYGAFRLRPAVHGA